MSENFDQSRIASDVARSRGQYLARRLAAFIVRIMGLNRVGFLSTEIVQAINPVREVRTRWGSMKVYCGHGRLLWRAETYDTEEPETIAWLDELAEDDLLWDIGANVGMYSIYAAKFKHCHVVAFEPESQNFAILVRNINLNGIQGLCTPANLAVADQSGIGKLHVRYLTQGGAYNSFDSTAGGHAIPESNQDIWQTDEVKPITQIMYGAAMDDLVEKAGMEAPTHIKIDVDGLEPLIIAGGSRLLGHARVKSVLVEINRSSKRDMEIPEIMKLKGFRLKSERSNWLSRTDRSREQEMPTTNMIFVRGEE
jgi:FkbM family methyltransferase